LWLKDERGDRSLTSPGGREQSVEKEEKREERYVIAVLLETLARKAGGEVECSAKPICAEKE